MDIADINKVVTNVVDLHKTTTIMVSGFGIILMVDHHNDPPDDDLRVDESSTLALDSVRVWLSFSISFTL